MSTHKNRIASILFDLNWQSPFGSHRERYYAPTVDYGRDTLPVGLKGKVIALGPGDSITRKMDPSDIPPFQPGSVLELPRSRFLAPVVDGKALKPRVGRFYPRRLLDGVPGAQPDSLVPFRVADGTKSNFVADLNHPMAGRQVEIKATVLEVGTRSGDPSGDPVHWPTVLLDGPGMQVRLVSSATDFLGNKPFTRKDESNDSDFYANPRMVDHLDSRALQTVRDLNGSVIREGMDVLDLMTGHRTHLPEGLKPASVTGLGLNAQELEANPSLTERVVHNLNLDPTLPFADGRFHVVVCNVSVEYLTQPFEVFEEAARVLRPGGVFMVTFSNRWFEDKAVHIWTRIHEFERMGLVCQYFMRPELFEDLHTLSDRGRPRPVDPTDRYRDLPHSDPVYAVWATRKS